MGTSTPTAMCLCFVLGGSIDGPPTVLLGHKKRGLGTGNIVGLGGHIDSGETASQAAVREVAEESGLRVEESHLQHRADVTFTFPTRPPWNQTAAVFVTKHWNGEPASTDEITPEWFALTALPLESMWDDARYWLPRVLAGERLRVDVVFGDDCRTVRTATIDRLSELTASAQPDCHPAQEELHEVPDRQRIQDRPEADAPAEKPTDR